MLTGVYMEVRNRTPSTIISYPRRQRYFVIDFLAFAGVKQ